MARSALFRYFVRLLYKARSLTPSVSSISNPSHLSRRRFLRYSALAGGAAIAATAVPALSSLSPARSEMPRIVIVGGGIAGLNAAYQLRKLGLIAKILEAKPYVGGRMQSRAAVNSVLINDLGGSFINTDHEDILTLVDEFDLELFNRAEAAERSTVPETAFYFEGRAIPETELLEILRPLAEQLLVDATFLDEDFDTYAPRFDALSVADYLNQHQDKIPATAVRQLVENAIRTEYGVEAEYSSALQLLYTVLLVDGDSVTPIGSDENYLIKGGSSKLIERLTDALSDQIYTNMPLTRLEAQENGFHLTFSDRFTLDADYVILALPFMALRRVDLQVNLPDGLRRFIHEVNLGSNEKVFAGFNQRAWHQERGFIGEAWTDLGCSQVWEETQRQPDQSAGVLTFFLGGDEVHHASQRATSPGEDFTRQLNAVVPGIDAASTKQFYSTDWTNDPYVGGGYTSFKPGQYLGFGEYLYIESEDPDERVDVHVGNLVFAGEHLSDEFYGYMNGGAQTGRLAAEVVMSLVQTAH